ncbi:type II secretion system protein [Piscinibacter defluvii]|uniref:type II secretion system protein n=1 Tax=Piscinibacter defluvii TaxID=1796922 RepID=UPI000FDDDDE1|nr:type II secretion system protein [Piscinibacter defluvii]
MRRGEQRGRAQRGYTFVAVLLLLALVSLGLSMAGPLWSQQAQRDRERELLRIGTLYAQAIERYRDLSPGSLRQYPPSLDVLLLDTRFVGTQRHLRKAYGDPVNPGAGWGLLRDQQGGIVGVHSLSQAAPLAQGAVVLDDRVLPPAMRYSDWKFIAKGAT